jgi:hypothetical protein
MGLANVETLRCGASYRTIAGRIKKEAPRPGVLMWLSLRNKLDCRRVNSAIALSDWLLERICIIYEVASRHGFEEAETSKITSE